MILVDTSVWIDYLKGTFPGKNELTHLLEYRQVLMLECIAGELLQGARSERERTGITQYWHLLPSISMDGLWIEAGIMSSEEKLLAKGIGLIDAVILAACRKTGAKLWTLDKKLLNTLPAEQQFSGR